MISAPLPPLLIVVSGPSGSGKGTALSVLTESGFERVVTYTTRSRRPQEVDGRDYDFISASTFHEKYQRGDFLEFNQTYGSAFYASPSNLLTFQQDTRPQVMELDPEGFFFLRSHSARRVIGLFTLPPSLPELEARIRLRAKTGDVNARLTVARQQVMQASEYDYVFENAIKSEFEDTIDTFAKVILAEHKARKDLTTLIGTIRHEQAFTP